MFTIAGADTYNFSSLFNGTADEAYPRANLLIMAFTSTVSGLSFTFDDFGVGDSYYTAYGSSNNVI